MGHPLPPVPITELHRDRVVKLLSEAFANDRLSVDELDRRLALVYRAQSLPELDVLLDDPLAPGMSLAEQLRVVASDAVVPDRGVAAAIMGAFEAKGGWLVPRELKVWAVAGGGELDLREARFAPGLTRIDVVAFMGGVDLQLPPGVRVEITGAGFLGGFQHETGEPVEDPYAPVVRVSGLAFAGAVDVKSLPRDRKHERRYVEALERAEAFKRRR
jgi:hypothetical protein